MRYFVDIYEKTRKNPNLPEKDMIKWDAELERYVKVGKGGIAKKFEPAAIIKAAYRPFVSNYLYFDKHFNGRTYQLPSIFQNGNENNKVITITGGNTIVHFSTYSVPDLHFVGDCQCLPRYRYTADGTRVDNITDWALSQFEHAYGQDKKRPLTKDAIFHYCYGVLHDPLYREKYALNLKRDFPRLPFYPDFWRWAAWGEQLMALHIGFETIDPWPLTRLDVPDTRARTAGVPLKVILKSDADSGIITVDSETTLTGIPPAAFTYKLGNRSGLDWILDQYKEKTPKDPTIREKFNTYRLADYKEKVIDLIARVTRVSVETVAITQAMQAASPLQPNRTYS